MEKNDVLDRTPNNNTTTTTMSCQTSNRRIIEPVVDSSRYFVVTIVDPIHHRRAYIGIGFRERMDATSLTLTLQDYERSRQREFLAKKQQLENQIEQQQGGEEELQSESHPISSLSKESYNRPLHSAVVPVLRKKPPPPSSSTATTSKEVSDYDDDDDDEWTEFQ